MDEQKKEAREGLMDHASLVDSLEKIYEMEVTRPHRRMLKYFEREPDLSISDGCRK